VIITAAAFLSAGLTPRRKADTEARRHALHRLGHIFEAVVAGAGKTDHDSVAGQLVGAQALESTDVLDAGGVGRRRDKHDGGKDAGEKRAKHACVLKRG
jgi:hypothetical protein